MAASPEITRLSTKGQIVLPSSIRHARQWEAGMEFIVQETAEGILLTPVTALQPAPRIEDVAGMLKPRHRLPVSLADMESAVSNEAIQRHARGRY